MGGKVSTKMAAAGRVIQAVRPHAPLIKFPNRQDGPKPNVQEVLKILSVNISPSSTSPSPSSAPAPLSRPLGPVTLLPGKPDTLANIQELPQRYRRRPMTAEEMDYIQRGGPE
ncbi:alpha-ketoglutarate dehydrogenase component 4 [Aplochiton taeniatus]